jgi:adenylate kinase family enzyme
LEANHFTEIRKERLSAMSNMARFNAEWASKGSDQWAKNIALRKERSSTEFARTMKVKGEEARQQRAGADADECVDGIESFEKTLSALPPMPHRAWDATLPKPSPGEENNFQEYARNLKLTLPTPKETQQAAEEEMLAYESRKAQNDLSQKERARRRHLVMASTYNSFATEESETRAALSTRHEGRKCEEEQRIDEELWRCSQQKEIVRENYRFQEQQYEERRDEQRRQNLARDKQLHETELELFEESVQLEQRRYEEIRTVVQQTQHQSNVEYCRSLVSRLVELVHKTSSYKTLADKEWVPETAWREWTDLLVQDQLLLPNATVEGATTEVVEEVAHVDEVAVAEPEVVEKESKAAQKESKAAVAEPEAVEKPAGEMEGFGSVDMVEVTSDTGYLMSVITDLNDTNTMSSNKCTMEDYLGGRGPWKPEIEVQFQNALLGRIVHKTVSLACGNADAKPFVGAKRAPIAVCILGKPFAGKKTQAKLLAEKYKLKTLNMDALLEEALSNLDALPMQQKVRALLKEGRPVTDEVYVKLVVEAITSTPMEVLDHEVVEEAVAVVQETHIIVNSEEEAGVVKIQAIARGKADRAKVDRKKKQKEEGAAVAAVINLDSVDEVQVVKIQAMARGKADRAMVVEKKKQEGEAAAAVTEQSPAELELKTAAIPSDLYRGWVLVGFPETQKQAMLLESALSGYVPPEAKIPGPPVITSDVELQVPSRIAVPPKPTPRNGPLPSGVDLVLRLDVDNEAATRRALGRRFDPVDNKYYHIERRIPDEDAPVKERLVMLEDDFDLEAKLPEHFSGYTEHEIDLETWFSDFGTLRSLDALPSKPDMSIVLSDLLNGLVTRRREEAESKEAAETARADQEKRLLVEQGEEAEAIHNWMPKVPEAQGEEVVSDQVVVEAKAESVVSGEGDVEATDQGPTENDLSDMAFIDQFKDTEVATLLSKQWIDIETAYTSDLMQIFQNLRESRIDTIKHYSLIRNNFLRLLARSDNKQNLVEDFAAEFNSLDADLRTDPIAKDELHLRTDELQEALQMLTDSRKRTAEDQFEEVREDQWLERSASTLVDHYCWMMQCELRRYRESVRIAQDFMGVLRGSGLNEAPEAAIPTLPLFEAEVPTKGGKAPPKKAPAAKKDTRRPSKSKGGKAAVQPEEGRLGPAGAFLEAPLEKLQTNFEFAKKCIVGTEAEDDVETKGKNAKKDDKKDAKKKGAAVAPPVVEEELTPLQKRRAQLLDVHLKSLLNTENTILTTRLESIRHQAETELKSLSGDVEGKLYVQMDRWLDERVAAEKSSGSTLVQHIKATIELESPLHHQYRLESAHMYIDGDKVVHPIPTLPKHSPFDIVDSPEYRHHFTWSQFSAFCDHCRCAASLESTMPTDDAVLLVTHLSGMQWRMDPQTSLPLGLGSRASSQYRAAVDSMDPLGTRVVDWREFALAFALPGTTAMPTTAQLRTMGAAFLAAASPDGAVTEEQFANVPLWFEDSAPQAAIVEAPEAMVDTGAPVIGGQPLLPEPKILRAVLFHIFSTKNVGQPIREPEEVVGAGEPNTKESAIVSKAPQDILQATIGTDTSLAFVEMLLYLCFDDAESSGLSKAETVLTFKAAPKEGAGIVELPPVHSDSILRFLERGNADKSHFSRKSLRFHPGL